MSSSNSGPSRLARTAAKEVPHRTTDRFFAAKSAVRSSCEDLVHDVRRSHLHDSMKADLLRAVDRIERELHDISATEDGGRTRLVEIDKELQHLRMAEKWVAASERVLTRLGTNGPKATRDELLEAQDSVMWCVRAHVWNGQLTSSLARLQRVVQDAEVRASRTAS